MGYPRSGLGGLGVPSWGPVTSTPDPSHLEGRRQRWFGENVRVPELVRPTPSVAQSYIRAEKEVCSDEGVSDAHLDEAAADFDAFARKRRATRELWGVPVTELWFVDGADYLGTVVARLKLTAELLESGGHLGFHVVPHARRRGHGRRMLAEAIRFCLYQGMTEFLLTCDEDNLASRRVIEANGGMLERVVAGEARYWIRRQHARPPEHQSPAMWRSRLTRPTSDARFGLH
jgi:predicted acetyltransferase